MVGEEKLSVELALALLVVLVIIILSFIAPKLISWLFVIGSFVGITATSISAKGFPDGLVQGVLMGGFIAFIGWVRFSRSIAATEKARSRLENNSKCERCGNGLSYHRMPKNPGQLLFGGLTCKNCGAEYDVSLTQLL